MPLTRTCHRCGNVNPATLLECLRCGGEPASDEGPPARREGEWAAWAAWGAAVLQASRSPLVWGFWPPALPEVWYTVLVTVPIACAGVAASASLGVSRRMRGWEWVAALGANLLALSVSPGTSCRPMLLWG